MCKFFFFVFVFVFVFGEKGFKFGAFASIAEASSEKRSVKIWVFISPFNHVILSNNLTKGD